MVIRYEPDGPVLTRFLMDKSPFAAIQGPVGSGSSSACIMKMFLLAGQQKANSEGIRKTRWVVVRPSYPSLQQTVVKTYRDWIRPGSGSPEMILTPPYRHHIVPDCPLAKMSDRTRMDMEVIFLAVDPLTSDFGFLDSYEMTGVFINEAQEYPNLEVISALDGRAAQGRYPPPREGGPTWCGTFIDLNAPPEGHWLPYMRGDIPMPEHWTASKRAEFLKPESWKFFTQPPGLVEVYDHKGAITGYEDNPAAENKKWRRKNYSHVIQGKTKAWIDAKVMNRVGIVREGDPVFPMFSLERNVSDRIEPVPGIALTVGLDLARNPFACIGQNVRGSWRVYSELGARGVSATQFGPMLKRHLFQMYPDMVSQSESGIVTGVDFWGDPSGTRKGDGTDDSSFSVLRSLGITINPAPGNNSWEIRRGAVENVIMRVTPDGDPGLLIHKHNAPTVKNGLYTGYILGDDNMPKKNLYADACDAVQYMVLGGGEGRAVITGSVKKAKEPVDYRGNRGPRRMRRIGTA